MKVLAPVFSFTTRFHLWLAYTYLWSFVVLRFLHNLSRMRGEVKSGRNTEKKRAKLSLSLLLIITFPRCWLYEMISKVATLLKKRTVSLVRSHEHEERKGEREKEKGGKKARIRARLREYHKLDVPNKGNVQLSAQRYNIISYSR